MQTSFNVVLKSFHAVTVNLPGLGDTGLLPGREIQLLNAPINVVNYLRTTFNGSGVTVTINGKSDNPMLVHDYGAKKEEVKEEAKPVQEPPHETPLEKVANYELPSGKHKGKKVKELDDEILKVIARTTKNPTVKSVIEAYLNLK